MQEIFIIIQGKAMITVDQNETTLEKGDVVSISPPSPHMMKNIGTEDVEYIAMGVSGGENGKTVVV